MNSLLPMNRIRVWTITCVLGVSACATQPIPNTRDEISHPEHWRGAHLSQSPDEALIIGVKDPKLAQWIELGLQRNYALAQAKSRLDQAYQGWEVAGASLYPELSLSVDASRRETTIATTSNFSLGLDLSYEIDLWGKLSAADRQANLQWAASRASYARAQNQLRLDIASAWYNLLEAQELLSLYQNRKQNLDENLDIIEQGYKQGLNSALDVYLARSDRDQETSRVASQQHQVSERKRAMSLLLGDYPQTRIEPNGQLTTLDTGLPAGLPAELLRRRGDLQALWLNLLAQDAAVAVAYKNRFPQLRLTGSLGYGSEELGDLISGDSVIWSLANGLTQPLFNAGRLKAQQNLEQARFAEQESAYLEAVYQAFNQVESALSNGSSLVQQYQAMIQAANNAVQAENLAFEQYQKGLVNYTTVLESQRRAFDANTQLVQLKNQRLQNRITLQLALGGALPEDNLD